MSKHSPGPWQCYADLPSTQPNWHVVTNANRSRCLANVHIEPGNAMDLANARLITQSPAMFSECRRALEVYRTLLPGPTAKRENIKSLRECISRLEAILAVVDPEDVLLKGGDA